MAGSVRVAITPAEVEVTPGSSVTLAVRVVNATAVVDEFTVEVVGATAPWATVDRPQVSLLPGQEEAVEVTLSPPREEPPAAGPQTGGVKVASVTQPDIGWVEELPVLVAPVTAATLAVKPQQVRAGRSARFAVRAGNDGNVALQLTLRGEDPEEAVEFAFDPPRLDVPPGGRAVARVQASADRAWTGPDVTRPLTVHADGSDQPLTATTTFVQRSRITGGLMKVAGVLAVAGLAGLGFLLANGVLGQDPIVDESAAETSEEATPDLSEDDGDGDLDDDGEPPDETQPFAVPAVVGQKRVKALSLLDSACAQAVHCPDAVVVKQFDEAVKKKRVISVEPSEGSQVAPGDDVTLTVSMGAEPSEPPTATGTWVHENPDTQGITRLEIAQYPDFAIVHAWEHCTPQDCDRGLETGSFEGNEATFEWDHESLERTMTLVALAGPGRRLRVDVETSYADGRSPTQESSTFEWVPDGPRIEP